MIESIEIHTTEKIVTKASLGDNKKQEATRPDAPKPETDDKETKS